MTAAAKSLITKALAKGPSTYDKTILSKQTPTVAIDGAIRQAVLIFLFE
jgi:hypothetical protein